ncbi:MAG TPA: DUF2278 family protein [Vicinamibacterales bacterium]|jgi:uncharacterized protein YukJ|nr:DUF2278 family protein [Vicinamibacterales bacterium]
MPIAKYGLLVGRPLHGVPGRGTNAHYQVHVVDDTTEYRIALNVKSQLAPSEVEYLVDDDFHHPLTASLRSRAPGFYRLGFQPADGGLDYIRGNLFDRTRMRPLPMNLPGPDDDLNDQLDRVVQAAVAEEDALVYAFGQRWGPEDGLRDKIFGFLPGNGIHDIHMNQGNSGQFVNDDGVWQDGGLLVHFPSIDRWTAVFLKFQSQSWHTDDVTGHAIATPVPDGEPDLRIRIVAALVNPHGGDQGHETVTLLNVTDADQPLAGWAIANRNKAKCPLAGVIQAGATLTVTLPVDVPLSNDGGLITLLDGAGLKVHGVSYTKAEAARQGWTVAF